MKTNWTAQNLGSQQGKTVLVTGANSGIGFHAALEFGRAGANVVIACRDPKRGEEALSSLRQQAPGAAFSLEALDLASLASVKAFSERFLKTGRALDLLINNAGLMAPPTRELTSDGFERQFGTNHLGHFALTVQLLPALKKSAAPRVVVVSSSVALFGKVELENLQSEKKYTPMGTYGQSKLSNLLFKAELERRAPWLTVTACHPGAAITGLQKYAFAGMIKYFGQPAKDGALPTLRAAVDEALPGTWFGPKDLFGMRGAPVVVKLPKRALNLELARALWEASEQATGVRLEAVRAAA